MFHSKKQLIDKPIEVKELPGEKPKHKKKKTNKDFFEGVSSQPPVKTKSKK